MSLYRVGIAIVLYQITSHKNKTHGRSPTVEGYRIKDRFFLHLANLQKMSSFKKLSSFDDFTSFNQVISKRNMRKEH